MVRNVHFHHKAMTMYMRTHTVRRDVVAASGGSGKPFLRHVRCETHISKKERAAKPTVGAQRLGIRGFAIPPRSSAQRGRNMNLGKSSSAHRKGNSVKRYFPKFEKNNGWNVSSGECPFEQQTRGKTHWTNWAPPRTLHNLRLGFKSPPLSLPGRRIPGPLIFKIIAIKITTLTSVKPLNARTP
jgi:hypothetical protein